ncbi:NTP transferase domain-containing protein [Cellulomonas sp. 179-A 4D5 NHS]|uniref:nucleotidyltransferase family protein n=1 Tax=Cellulomonas sp. 179-A 4D5 NHS TaxID=3142378 RepID=UPI00399FE445
MTSPILSGLVLAAGAGSRFGGPKALARTADGEPWVARAVRVLLDGGCDRVVVALGARADDARGLVPDDARVSVAVVDDWASGVSASLRAGLVACGDEAEAVLVTLVDLPGLPVEVVRRVARRPFDAGVLRQAVHGARPGHPVLLGRSHRPALLARLDGDTGARAYLAAHGAEAVECGDLFDGEDADRPPGG